MVFGVPVECRDTFLQLAVDSVGSGRSGAVGVDFFVFFDGVGASEESLAILVVVVAGPGTGERLLVGVDSGGWDGGGLDSDGLY